VLLAVGLAIRTVMHRLNSSGGSSPATAETQA